VLLRFPKNGSIEVANSTFLGETYSRIDFFELWFRIPLKKEFASEMALLAGF
jgi:hypothetical protein